MEAQLIFTKGCIRRELFFWMMEATFSLPTPVSPVISTLQSYLATLRISSTTWVIALLSLMKSSSMVFLLTGS